MTSQGDGRDVDPRELRQGDRFTYMIRDTLALPGDPLVPAGEWQIISDERYMGSHVGVDDEGRAYDVPAVIYHCRSADGRTEEPKVFPVDQRVKIRRDT